MRKGATIRRRIRSIQWTDDRIVSGNSRLAEIRHDGAASLEIAREAQDGGGRYHTVLDGHPGQLLYTDEKGPGGIRRVAYSTRVDKALSGRGVGLALVKRLVADARAEHARIDPQCSFVRVMIGRHPEWADVLVEDEKT